MIDASNAVHFISAFEVSVWSMGTLLEVFGNMNSVGTGMVMPISRAAPTARMEAVLLGRLYHLLEGQLTLYS